MKILNFGSLNIDHVYQVERFVQPGETAAAKDLHLFAGGKGLNQSVALAAAGGTVFHAGAVGEDGAFLIELLQSRGVDTSLIRTLDTPTGHAVIQVEASGQNCILLYGGANQGISQTQITETLAQFQKGDLLLLQNEINGNPLLIEQAYEAGLEIALNPSPMDARIHSLPLEKVGWFLLNQVEGGEMTGEIDPERILSALARRWSRSRTVLTLGKRGAMVWDGDRIHRHGIYATPVVDTTGAGDTFTGYFLSSLARGLPVDGCLELASKAAAIAVSAAGAAESIPTFDQVIHANLTYKEP